LNAKQQVADLLNNQQVSALLQQYPQLASVYQQLLATLVPGRDWTDVVTTVVQILPTVISVISRNYFLFSSYLLLIYFHQNALFIFQVLG